MAVVERLNRRALLVEYGKSFFPVLFIVLVLRSFLVEPSRFGVDETDLEVGDFILVNKFSYGIRLPVIDKKVIEVGDPQRGDVMVFRYPSDPNVNYIKRVVGLPGDVVRYTTTSGCSSTASRLPSNWWAPSRAPWAAPSCTRKNSARPST
jgi:signal peptidase I